MEFEYANSPVWANPEKTQINLIVKFRAISSELPFTADPNDSEQHGRTLFSLANSGEFGPVAEYVPPPDPVFDPNDEKGEVMPILTYGNIPGTVL